MGDDASIVLTIPEGWTARAGFDNYPTGTDIRKHADQPGELMLWVDATDSIAVYPSVCGPDADAVSDAVPVGPTVDDLVTAIRAQDGSEISEPVDVAVGGRDVQRFEISFGQGVDAADCEDGTIRVLYSKAFGFVSSPFAGEPLTRTVYMVQTDAGRIVFLLQHGDDASAADIAELDAIVESMVIEP